MLNARVARIDLIFVMGLLLMAIILGIDPGSRITGYGVINQVGQTIEGM